MHFIPIPRSNPEILKRIESLNDVEEIKFAKIEIKKRISDLKQKAAKGTKLKGANPEGLTEKDKEIYYEIRELEKYVDELKKS